MAFKPPSAFLGSAVMSIIMLPSALATMSPSFLA
nr:MAG TPA: hypothetical protein [Caudoviricetes sp.]